MKKLLLLAGFLLIFGCSRPTQQTVDLQPQYKDGKVTISAHGETLPAFLEKLSALTGTNMTAADDVSELKLIAIARELPLSELQEAMKSALHVQTREVENTIEFYRDEATIGEMEKLKKKEPADMKTGMETLVKQLIALEKEGTNPLDMPNISRPFPMGDISNATDIEKLSLDSVLNLDSLAALTAYSLLTPAQTEELWSGKTVSIRPDQLPNALQNKLSERAVAWYKSMNNLSASSSVPLKLDSFDLYILEQYDSNRKVLHYSAQFKPVGKSSPLGSELPYGIGTHLDVIGLTEPSPPIPWDYIGNLSKENKFTVSHDVLDTYKFLDRVSEEAKASVVSDYWTRNDGPPMFPDASNVSFKSLDDAIKHFDGHKTCTYAKKGDAYIFSSRTWYKDSEREIPGHLVDKYMQAKQSKEGYTIIDIIDMSKNLNALQMQDLKCYGLGDGGMLSSCTQALALINTLSPSELNVTTGSSGLPVTSLSSGQYSLLMEWARGQGDMSKYGTVGPVTEGRIRKGSLKTDYNRKSGYFSISVTETTKGSGMASFTIQQIVVSGFTMPDRAR